MMIECFPFALRFLDQVFELFPGKGFLFGPFLSLDTGDRFKGQNT